MEKGVYANIEIDVFLVCFSETRRVKCDVIIIIVTREAIIIIHIHE